MTHRHQHLLSGIRKASGSKFQFVFPSAQFCRLHLAGEQQVERLNQTKISVQQLELCHRFLALMNGSSLQKCIPTHGKSKGWWRVEEKGVGDHQKPLYPSWSAANESAAALQWCCLSRWGPLWPDSDSVKGKERHWRKSSISSDPKFQVTFFHWKICDGRSVCCAKHKCWGFLDFLHFGPSITGKVNATEIDDLRHTFSQGSVFKRWNFTNSEEGRTYMWREGRLGGWESKARL